MNDNHVSEAVIRRLPKYYRKLQELEQRGVQRISSRELSVEMGLNASQIRRDFNCFGGFGQQGYGYQVTKLKTELMRILGLDKTYHCVVLGAGYIGRALMAYRGFAEQGFDMAAIFDTDPNTIGTDAEDKTVQSMDTFEDYVKSNPVDIAVICVPKENAQQTCDLLAKLKIKLVWNFAPIELDGPEWMYIENVNLSDSIFILSYRESNEQ